MGEVQLRNYGRPGNPRTTFKKQFYTFIGFSRNIHSILNAELPVSAQPTSSEINIPSLLVWTVVLLNSKKVNGKVFGFPAKPLKNHDWRFTKWKIDRNFSILFLLKTCQKDP